MTVRKTRSKMQLYMEFALWANRRSAPPTPHQVAEFFGVHLDSARKLRKSFLDARGAAAQRVAIDCVQRIHTKSARAIQRALKDASFSPPASTLPHASTGANRPATSTSETQP